MSEPINNVTLTGQETPPAVTVVPDVVESPSAPVPQYAVDPSTGFPVDVIMTGECKENSLGDTRTQPIGMSSISPAPQDSYGPAFGTKGEAESPAEDKTEVGEE